MGVTVAVNRQVADRSLITSGYVIQAIAVQRVYKIVKAYQNDSQ